MQNPHSMTKELPALRRPTEGRLVAGVAAGLADHFDLDVVVVRIALVALTLVGGLGVPLYVAAWLLVPDEGTTQSVVEEMCGRMCCGRPSSGVGATSKGGAHDA